ncbi:MAG: LytTR family DNA-binding domain-containing protein [Crocinitomicaceae bacterium]|nr:LytTR family DNA-binding domain-containing protein [Crocinitomicaceae bacterium]
MNVLIVDDAEQARKLLRLTLAEIAPDISNIKEAEDVDDAIVLIKKNTFDIVFLDIEMPGKSGLQLVEELKDTIDFEIIFITAYSQYAIDAFKLSAVDYLLKPFRESELEAAVNKAKESIKLKKNATFYESLITNIQYNTDKIITMPINYGYEYIKLADIQYIEADGAYSTIHLKEGDSMLVSRNLKYFEKLLCDRTNFCKINRSIIVCLNCVKSYLKKDRGVITLCCGKEVKLSANHVDTFVEKMEKME